ncbi:MAG: response regulator [Planctomycetota bacterium]
MARFVVLLLACTAVATSVTHAQNISQPLVRYFSPDEIGSDGRVFAIAQDGDGFVYAAIPDDRLLMFFDGANWIELDVPAVPFSLIDDANGRVWVGMDSGVGYIERDELGSPQFHSYPLGEESDYHLCAHWAARYEKGVRLGDPGMFVEIDTSGSSPVHRVLDASPDSTFVGFDGPKLHVSKQAGSVVTTFGDTDEQIVTLSPEVSIEATVAFGRAPDNLVLVTDEFSRLRVAEGDGFRDFSPELQELEAGSLDSVFPIGNDLLGCASGDALILLNRDGAIAAVIDKTTGLPGNGIVGFGDLRNGLSWVSTDRGGFSTIEFSQSMYAIPFPGDQFPIVYDLAYGERHVFVASNLGVYSFETSALGTGRDKKPVGLKLDKITGDRCFRLINMDGVILAPTETGIYRTDGDTTEMLFNGLFYSGIRLDDKHILIDSHVSGNQIFAIDENASEIRPVNAYRGFSLEKIFVLDDHRLLVVPAEDTFKLVDFGGSWENVPEINDIPMIDGASFTSEFNSKIAVRIEDQWLPLYFDSDGNPVSGDPGEFRFINELQSRFKEMTPTPCDDCGVVMFEEWYLALFEDSGQPASSIEATGEWVAGNEFRAIYSWDAKRQLFWTQVGDQLVGVNILKPEEIAWSTPVVSGSSEDDLLQSKGGTTRLGPLADIRFSFGAPVGASHAAPSLYQYRLKGLDDWTEPGEETTTVYSRLPGGSYEFQVRPIQTDGEPGAAVTFPFYVQQPWYFSSAAIFGYFLAGLGLIFAVSSLRARQLAAANRRMERLVNERTAEIARTRLEVAEKSAELDHKKRMSEAERLASFDTLVAGIAHDFNNLLTVISANNDLVLHKFGEDATRLTESSSVAIDSAAELCRELAAFSDSTPLELKTVSASSLVREIGPMLDDAIEGAIHLETRFVDGRDYFEVDTNQLRRAVLNLVVNASEVASSRVIVNVEPMRLTGDELKGSRFVGDAPAPGNYVSIEVCDDGPGVPEEVIARVFDPFFSTKQMGRGLGLAIVMKIISRHRGLILVKRKEDLTCFQICIPASRQPDKQPDAVSSQEGNPEFVDIVFVDDDPLVLQSTAALLADLGHRVETFESARSSLKYIETSRKCRLAILDLSMPEVSGVDLANQILVMRPELPILFVSGYTDKKIDPPVIERSNVAFLAKPFSRKQLREAIQGAIRTSD